MAREPYRLFSAAGEDRGENPRIYGLETEYAVLYQPRDPGDRACPRFEEIENVLFAILLSERKAATSSGLKGGYFLENGGLVHLEIFLRDQGDTPILEASTPECRSPWDLLLYSRAFDHLLRVVSERSEAALVSRGYHGRLAFGKNNTDSYGVGYGCHENFLIHSRSSRWQQVAYVLSLPWILASLLPAVLVFVCLLSAFCVATLAGRLFPPSQKAFWRFVSFLREKRLMESLLAGYYIVTNLLLFPAIALYSALLRRLAFREFSTHLTPFLVSRQLLAGAGRLNFEQGVFELSQRAFLTRSLETIVMFGRRKTVFDLKGLLYDPLSLFRPTKRLTLTVGDSNLSDVPNLLKVGATALVIEMVEHGERFEDLRLSNPIRALREVSEGGPWKQVRLRNGRLASAVEIQREYLRRAKSFYGARRDGRLRACELLELWEDCLEPVAERPQTLADWLDWAAKKSLLDAVILPAGGWSAFFRWGRLFVRAGLRASARASSLDELLESVSRWRRWRLERVVPSREVAEEEFQARRDLYFQARKIDLRYHEISAEGGYHQVLEKEGLIERLTVDEDEERASREPPRDTRARIRGYYIQLSPNVRSVQANWGEVELQSPLRHIALPDPFYHRLPGE